MEFARLRLALNGTVCTPIENSTAVAGVASQLISASVSAESCFTFRNFVAHFFRIIQLVAEAWFCSTLRVPLALHSTENSALLGLKNADRDTRKLYQPYIMSRKPYKIDLFSRLRQIDIKQINIKNGHRMNTDFYILNRRFCINKGIYIQCYTK